MAGTKKDDSTSQARQAQEALTKAAATLQTVAKPVVNLVVTLLPHVINYANKAHAFYLKLPVEVIRFVVGTIFCFFGGLYPTLFSAIQAAEHGGRKSVVQALKDLSEEAMVIIEASKKDDKTDADRDGIADVDQIGGKEYILRKANLVMIKMNPEKVDKALASIYTVWLSVLAVLKIQFAKTIALALTISQFLNRPAERLIAPTLKRAVPADYQKWVPVVLGWTTKSIAMSIAWYVQTVISAFTSALAGGLMMSRALLKFCVKHGYSLNGLIPERHEDTYVDELASYVFAALGFYFQFIHGFRVPFPLNIVFFPFQFAEYYIRWTITSVN